MTVLLIWYNLGDRDEEQAIYKLCHVRTSIHKTRIDCVDDNDNNQNERLSLLEINYMGQS